MQAGRHEGRASDSSIPPPGRLWRNRNFICLWLAYAVSAFGDHLSEMGLLQMQDALHRDDSTQIQAVMSFSFMLPFFLLGPGMGWLADRLPRKWIMVVADVIRGGLMVSLYPLMVWVESRLHGSAIQLHGLMHSETGTPLLNPWFYSMPLLLMGIFAAMFSPSRAALLPTLVREDQLVRANALTNALGPLMSILSYVAGGYLVHRYGVQRNFFVDGLTFFASAACILMIFPPVSRRIALQSRERQRPALDAAEHNEPVACAPGSESGMLAGFRYVAAHRRAAEVIVFATLFWAAASVVNSTVPALIQSVGGGNIEQVGYFKATLGIGILIGALLLSVLGESLKPQITVTWSIAGAGLGVLWLAAVTMGIGLGKVSGYAGLFVAGFFGAGVLVSVNALLQRIVPDCFRGRVFGVSDFCSMAGLLLATGLLGIPHWPHIDRYLPWILGVVGAVLLVAGLISVKVRLSRGRFTGWLNFWLNVNYIGCRLWGRLRRIGPCTIPGTGPVIVVCNHVSTADHFLLLASSPNRILSFMIAKEYYKMPVIGRIVKVIDCIPVNRTGADTASIRAALRHLEQNKVLAIFPQGRIRPLDDTEPPRDGVGLLALRSGATVIPAYVRGIRPTQTVLGPFLWPHHAEVRFGKPVDLSAWRDREGDKAAYKEAAAAIMAAIRSLKPN